MTQGTMQVQHPSDVGFTPSRQANTRTEGMPDFVRPVLNQHQGQVRVVEQRQGLASPARAGRG
jgi:hypothetical protein